MLRGALNKELIRKKYEHMCRRLSEIICVYALLGRRRVWIREQ